MAKIEEVGVTPSQAPGACNVFLLTSNVGGNVLALLFAVLMGFSPSVRGYGSPRHSVGFSSPRRGARWMGNTASPRHHLGGGPSTRLHVDVGGEGPDEHGSVLELSPGDLFADILLSLGAGQHAASARDVSPSAADAEDSDASSRVVKRLHQLHHIRAAFVQVVEVRAREAAGSSAVVCVAMHLFLSVDLLFRRLLKNAGAGGCTHGWRVAKTLGCERILWKSV